jgi:hypothetical protein
MKQLTLIIALAILMITAGSGQDTTKVSLSATDQEIQQRTQELKELLKNIDDAKQQSLYLQGALDMLKSKRSEYAAKDTAKTVTKKGVKK